MAGANDFFLRRVSLNDALQIIQNGAYEELDYGMEVVHRVLNRNDLLKDTDRIVVETFDLYFTGASSDSCECVLNTLLLIFKNKKQAYAVKESTLYRLITELTLLILDVRLQSMKAGDKFVEKLNILILTILNNAEGTSNFVVLMNLLRPLDPSRWRSSTSNESLVTREKIFSDCIGKYLDRFKEVLQRTIMKVDIDRLIQSIHMYLQDLGKEEILRRAGAQDQQLHIVKSILEELVKFKGSAINNHLSYVPKEMKPQPLILAYIDIYLKKRAVARILTPSPLVGPTQLDDSTTGNS